MALGVEEDIKTLRISLRVSKKTVDSNEIVKQKLYTQKKFYSKDLKGIEIASSQFATRKQQKTHYPCPPT